MKHLLLPSTSGPDPVSFLRSSSSQDFKKESYLYTLIKKSNKSFNIHNKFFFNEGGETHAQVAQGGSGGPIPGNFQGQS